MDNHAIAMMHDDAPSSVKSKRSSRSSGSSGNSGSGGSGSSSSSSSSNIAGSTTSSAVGVRSTTKEAEWVRTPARGIPFEGWKSR